jgi:S-DNA-T family DNA segregation ATPase FtsK/SpoIIIE
LATQRPDVNVITGTIKNNLSCRKALKVPAPQDSKTIINGAGADKLLGYGDMLYLGPGSSSPARIQGAYISNDEIKSLVEFLRDSNELYYDDSISNEIFVSNKPVEPDVVPELDEDDIPLQDQREYRIYMKKALRYWLTEKKGFASISSIQRGIRVGFNKAGTIKDLCDKMGYLERLSDAESSNRPVKVLVTLEQLDELFPDVTDEDMQNI